MKALLINAEKRTVDTIDIKEPVLQNWYKAIDCELVEEFLRLENGDGVLCDEEGMINLADSDDQQTHGFTLCDFVIAGNGLIVGTDYEEGDAIACKSNPEDILKRIEWIDTDIMKRYAIRAANTPPRIISW
jgi:hypothetical protein